MPGPWHWWEGGFLTWPHQGRALGARDGGAQAGERPRDTLTH